MSSLFGDRTYAGCIGSIDRRTPAGEGADAGASLDGWAWGGRDGMPSRVLFADAAGAVVGLAPSGVPRLDVRAAKPEVDYRAGFKGYASTSLSVELRLFTVSRAGRAVCEVGAGD